MPVKYLSNRAEEQIAEVQRHMKETVKVDLDRSNAISFMYNAWREVVISDAVARGETPPDLKKWS